MGRLLGQRTSRLEQIPKIIDFAFWVFCETLMKWPAWQSLQLHVQDVADPPEVTMLIGPAGTVRSSRWGSLMSTVRTP